MMARDDQITVRPPFDPAEFARQSERSTIPPPAQVPEVDPLVSTETSDPVVSTETSDPVVSTETTMEVLFVDGESVAALAVAREDLEWFDLSADVRELLHHVDGEARLAQVCARASRSVDDGVALVEQLVRDGVLTVR